MIQIEIIEQYVFLFFVGGEGGVMRGNNVLATEFLFSPALLIFFFLLSPLLVVAAVIYFIYLFIVYLTRLSVSQTIQCRMRG
jgi:hypothetical protein